MTPSILDTDTVSEFLRGRNHGVLRRAREYRRFHDHLSITAVTVVEMVNGYHAVGREDRVEQLLGEFRLMNVMPLGVEAAIIAGRITADLKRTGQPIGAYDPLIAAIAITHHRTLVTGNTRHYQRIIDLGYDLTLDDWREAA